MAQAFRRRRLWRWNKTLCNCEGEIRRCARNWIRQNRNFIELQNVKSAHKDVREKFRFTWGCFHKTIQLIDERTWFLTSRRDKNVVYHSFPTSIAAATVLLKQQILLWFYFVHFNSKDLFRNGQRNRDELLKIIRSFWSTPELPEMVAFDNISKTVCIRWHRQLISVLGKSSWNHRRRHWHLIQHIEWFVIWETFYRGTKALIPGDALERVVMLLYPLCFCPFLTTFYSSLINRGSHHWIREHLGACCACYKYLDISGRFERCVLGQHRVISNEYTYVSSNEYQSWLNGNHQRPRGTWRMCA